MAAKDGVLIRRRLRIFAAAVALVLLCAVCVGGVSGADVWDGTAVNQVPDWYNSGVTDDDGKGKIYTIKIAKDLAGLVYMVNSGKDDFADDTIILEADIDLGAKIWTPIGSISGLKVKSNGGSFSGGGSGKPFSGTFDGNGKSISNLYLYPNEGTAAGLFGYVDAQGTIKNLNLDGEFTVTGDDNLKTSCYINLNEKDIIAGSLVGLLEGGTVESCFVREFGVNVPTGSQGNNRIFGGLIGYITDADGSRLKPDSSGMYNLDEYLTGGSSVIVVDTGYGKTWGLLVGYPTVGSLPESEGDDDDHGGTSDVTSATYIVNIYKMKPNGEYDEDLTVSSAYTSSQTYVGLVGSIVSAEYTIPEGHSLDTSKSNYLSGSVDKDGNLVLSVWLKRNTYTLRVVYYGASAQTYPLLYGSSLPIVIPPLRPGYTFLGWDAAFPSTMPANDLVITALWDGIEPVYTIVIPESLVISNETNYGDMSVSVDITELGNIGKLSIKVHSENNFDLVLENYQDIRLPYDLYVDGSVNPVVQDEVIGSFSSAISTSIPLKANVEATAIPQYSGLYWDTLTFTVQYSETP